VSTGFPLIIPIIQDLDKIELLQCVEGLDLVINLLVPLHQNQSSPGKTPSEETNISRNLLSTENKAVISALRREISSK